MPKRTIPLKPEDFRFGMDNYNPTKKLAAHVTQLLQNAFPGMTVKPRNGVEDIMVNTTALGDGSEHSLFRPHYLFITAGSKDFVFCWAQNVTTTDKYHLEVWNITDDTRTKLIYGDWNRTDIYFSMEKLYDAIYVTMNYEMGTNPNSSYRTKNKIIEWIDSAWAVREMNIDVGGSAGSLTVADAPESPWDERDQFAMCYFDNKFWLYGGKDGTNQPLVDPAVYYSYDGVEWIKGFDFTGDNRYGHSMLVYDNKMWIIGGQSSSTQALKDVWYSSDGDSWTQATADAGFGENTGHTSLSYDGKMWVMGGAELNGSVTRKDDTYSSTDGVTWTLVQGTCAFGALYHHASVVYDNKMWVIGGESTADANEDDVYYSTDGSTWTAATTSAAFSGRRRLAAVVFENKMWVVGGYHSTGPVYYTSVYYSTDGVTWTEATADMGIGRQWQHLIVYDEKIWVFGGNDAAAYYNDIYNTSDGITWTERTIGLDHSVYHDYAFTFVRRTDSNSELDAIANYNYELWHTINGETVVGIDEQLQSGTVSLSGTALTGSGTLFDEVLAAGDYIRINGTFKSYEITSVTDNTNAVVVNGDGDSYSAKEWSLIPTVGDPITTSTYHPGIVEGVEVDDNRVIKYMLQGTTEKVVVYITIPDILDPVAQGATHLRVYRSLGHATKATAQGLVKRYLVDISIKGDAFDSIKVYIDKTPDSTLTGETNLLEATPFSVPPLGRYSMWDGEKYWIGGVPDNEGHWFYSVNPKSGDVSFDVEFPQKFASWFNLKGDYITCDPADNQKDTGVADLAGDIYFFKERKIFVLFNGNPIQKPIRRSNVIGCACPQTITKGEIPQLGGECILFLSESGPAYITAGGQIKLLHEFTIDQLWPDRTGVLRKSTGVVTDWYTRNKVTAQFWQNTYWIFFGDSEDSSCNLSTNYCYGFRFGSDGKSIGPFQCTWPVASADGSV